MTYEEAIGFLAKGDIYKAIEDLSQIATKRMLDYRAEAMTLRAEKRIVKKYLNAKWPNSEKIAAIRSLVENDE